MNKIDFTMIELFSGIGSQKKAIDNTKLFNCKVVSTSDIDKEAMVSYAAIHNGLTNKMIQDYSDYPSKEEMIKFLVDKNIGYDFKENQPFDWEKIARRKSNVLKKYYLAALLSKNLGDISRIEELQYADLWTYSFPCQDISVAGKQSGIEAGKTRSGLLYEVERLLGKSKASNTLPRYLLLENVKNLVGSKFIDKFNDWISRLDELGYNTYWSVINGKNCGVPQNRERVFAVSIRKDVDAGLFTFPDAFDNGLRLIDFLEQSVDDKYYLSEVATKKFKLFNNSKGKEIKIAGTLNPEKHIQDRVRVLSVDGISQALRATDYKDPVKIRHNNMPEIIEETCQLRQVGQLYGTETEPNPQAGRVYNCDYISPTLDSCSGGKGLPKISECYKIRKLTPKECWRLMGFDDVDIEKSILVGTANTNLYKQAGNSIITNCIFLIMQHLYKAQYDNTYECYDEILHVHKWSRGSFCLWRT